MLKILGTVLFRETMQNVCEMYRTYAEIPEETKKILRKEWLFSNTISFHKSERNLSALMQKYIERKKIEEEEKSEIFRLLEKDVDWEIEFKFEILRDELAKEISYEYAF